MTAAEVEALVQRLRAELTDDGWLVRWKESEYGFNIGFEHALIQELGANARRGDDITKLEKVVDHVLAKREFALVRDRPQFVERPDAIRNVRSYADGMAASSRARIHGTLTALCAHLVRQGDLKIDPMAESGLERPKQPRSLPRYIERDAEIARVLKAAATADPNGRHVWPERDLALAAVLAGTAVRASELCRLRIRDLVLDVEDPYIRVTGKGGTVRSCPLRRS